MDYLTQKVLINKKIKALENHLGLNAGDVKRDLEHGYDDEFLVDFGYSQKPFPIEVIEESELVDNELAECYTKIIDSKTIKNNLYFRWL